MKLTDQEIQRIKKNLPLKELILFELFLIEYHTKSSKVEEMQKTLEWYADEKNHNVNVTDQWEPVLPIDQDKGNRARACLKGVETQ